jgi:hypothetical protein
MKFIKVRKEMGNREISKKKLHSVEGSDFFI